MHSSGQTPPAGGSLFQQMYSAQQQQQQGYPGGGGQPYPPPPPQHGMQGGPGGNGGGPAPDAYPSPPQPYGGYNYNPQQAPPPQYGGYGQSSHPPSPPPPPQQQQPMAVYQPPVQDDDYYKGFHDGVVRPSGPVWGNAVSWLVPLFVNVAIFVGPIWYFRRRYMQAVGGAAGGAAAAAAGGKGKGGASSNPMSGLMDMMNPMKSKDFRTEVKGTTFKDVIGIPEAKEDLKQYVDFLKEPAKFTRLGARLPKGCLLTGQPGTGKTLLARAVAGEASTPFFSCSGADFIEIFGGSGPKRVRELFAEAKKAAPCVVFIDEIDAIGSRNQGGRSMGGGGSSEENRTINQLLAELDGLTSKEAIVVIAATNYPEAIDKALLREGRFDRKVNIPMPDQKARCELFEFYLNRIITGDPNCKPKVQVFKTRKEGESGGDSKTEKSQNTASTTNGSGDGAAAAAADKETKTLVTEDAKPESIKVIPGVSNKEYATTLADRTPGVSPAQISTIVNEGALNAAMNGKDVVPLDVLQDSIDDVLIGKKHRQRMSNTSLHRTAYHEVGHCIMAWTSPLQKDVIKLSIIPRGRAGGYTQQVQDEAMEPHTDEFLFSQLCVLMGGRAAERIFEKDISIGAMDDLQRATRLAMEKLLKYGMSKTIGQLAFKPNDKNDGRAWMTWSENLHAKAEAEARALVESAYVHTEKTLLAHKEQHEKLAELLLSKKELDKADIMSILGARPTLPA